MSLARQWVFPCVKDIEALRHIGLKGQANRMEGHVSVPASSGSHSIRLAESVRRYCNSIALLGCSCVILIAWLTVGIFAPYPWRLWIPVVVSIPAVALTLIEVIFHNAWLVRYFRAEISADSFTMSKGRFWVVECAIRKDAILSVDVETGPMLRRFGLARPVLYGIAAFPEMPPMSLDDAKSLQHALTADPQTEVNLINDQPLSYQDRRA